MNKILVFFMALAVLISMQACGGKEEGTYIKAEAFLSDPPSKENAETLKVAQSGIND